MRIREFEDWALALMAAQPWVKGVKTFADAGIKDRLIGLVIEPTAGPTARVHFVRASPTAPPSGDRQPYEPSADAQPVPVDASPSGPKEWAEALVAVLDANPRPDVSAVQTYDAWGKSSKPAGVRVAFADGSEAFGTVLDGR